MTYIPSYDSYSPQWRYTIIYEIMSQEKKNRTEGIKESCLYTLDLTVQLTSSLSVAGNLRQLGSCYL
jgi:hypothetical protein